VNEDDMFNTEQGFMDALYGIYVNMGKSDLYGGTLQTAPYIQDFSLHPVQKSGLIQNADKPAEPTLLLSNNHNCYKEVYQEILADLTEAKQLLSNDVIRTNGPDWLGESEKNPHFYQLHRPILLSFHFLPTSRDHLSGSHRWIKVVLLQSRM